MKCLWHYEWVKIGYQLTAENANEKNLITGTRYMNVDGMLPFENFEFPHFFSQMI